MAYNKAKEEKKWRLWKEAEEKQFPINLWRWYDEQRRKEMCPISESKY